MDPSPGTDRDFALSPEEQRLLPTDEEVQFYRDHGWSRPKPLLSAEEVDMIADAAERYWAGHRDRSLPVRPRNLKYWESSDGDGLRKNDYVVYESLDIGRILSKALIGAFAARLVDTLQIRILNCTLWYKPPSPDDPSCTVAWHKDGEVWQNLTSDKLVTAYFPFHDCDEEMGTLTFVDGSHRWFDSRCHKYRNDLDILDTAGRQAALEAEANERGTTIRPIRIRYQKGDVTFHDCRLWHGSEPNRSSAPRRSISLHLQDQANHWREYRLPSGEPGSYKHDVLVRRTPEGDPDYCDPAFCPVVWEAPRRGVASSSVASPFDR